ncbi:ALK tyrosine kinase receptor [Stylophora pistillata]|uniref:ALK tyrosine kinase receptor n=1 Tax=Stylophora pistillata TaxID=50429 RepID=A0A2B4R9B1_STYPI|nr:ALK tyrosine kinase receptor [Stylophora pistillata]
MEDKCKSINMGPSGEKDQFLCQLSDSDHLQHPKDLKPIAGFMYRGTENKGCFSMCYNNATCLVGFTDKGYKCICPPGYKGEYCEKGKSYFARALHVGYYNYVSILHPLYPGLVCLTCSDMSCDDLGVTHCPTVLGGVHIAPSDEYKYLIVMPGRHQLFRNTEISVERAETTAAAMIKLAFPISINTFSAVFTNLNASGRYGPTTLGSDYTGQDYDGQVTIHSGIQQWTVPYTGDYRIEAIGAAGGHDKYANSTQYRGRGARMIGRFRLNKSEIIQILVGQEGGINNITWSCGGGGGTFVVRGANIPLIIAGGGGGVRIAESRHEECDGSTNATGNPGYKSWPGGSTGHGAQTAGDRSSGKIIS